MRRSDKNDNDTSPRHQSLARTFETWLELVLVRHAGILSAHQGCVAFLLALPHTHQVLPIWTHQHHENVAEQCVEYVQPEGPEPCSADNASRISKSDWDQPKKLIPTSSFRAIAAFAIASISLDPTALWLDARAKSTTGEPDDFFGDYTRKQVRKTNCDNDG